MIWTMVPHRRLGSVMLLALVASLASLALPGGARADFGKDEKKFDNKSYPAEFRASVQQAIVRAANWLLTHQKDDGSWGWHADAVYPMGPSALATLALIKAGIPLGHPKMERAFAYLRRQPLVKTYEVAILLMVLDAKYDPIPDPFAKEEVDRYGNRVVPDPCGAQISKEDLAWMKSGVEFLVKHQSGGHWRYPSEGSYDLSNTQYALLGLKAASRCGIKIPANVWTDSLTFLLRTQEATGQPVDVRANEVRGEYRIEWTEKAAARGFRYVAEGPPKLPVTGSMTTAGAAGLMICQSELWKSRKFTAEQRAETRTAIRDALAWMQANFRVEVNPGMGMSNHYYYLYGLERMGILAHTRFIGPIDWYSDGAEFLLEEQDAPGSWEKGDVVETCFGLLFLKRSSFRTANPVITPSDPEPVMGGDQPPAPVVADPVMGK